MEGQKDQEGGREAEFFIGDSPYIYIYIGFHLSHRRRQRGKDIVQPPKTPRGRVKAAGGRRWPVGAETNRELKGCTRSGH